MSIAMADPFAEAWTDAEASIPPGRADYLRGLVGMPYEAVGKCWGLAVKVEADLFYRVLPAVAVPGDVTRKWIIKTFREHPAGRAWREIEHAVDPALDAADGALVLMAAVGRATHIGVWLKPERRVIHADATQVRCEEPIVLRANGWQRLRFFEPVT